MVTESYDIETEAVIGLQDFYGERKHLIDVCLIIFSDEIYEHLLDTFECEEIARLKICNGDVPIYKLDYKGKDVAFYLSAVGSAVASSLCYECSWITGASKFIMFGSCGSLDGEVTRGKYIIPTESYRGEGASYYYAPASDYIKIKNSDKLVSIFEDMKIPYVQGKVWSTDSMVRETKGLCAKRRAEGCIAVEMELAGVQAICDFYGMELYDFLEPGDVLADSGYEVEGLSAANNSFGKAYIGLNVATRL